MSQEKTKVHTIYKTKQGERVPSVTTILGILNKPALLEWAWNMGCQGQDYKAVRDDAATVGTLAHYLILCHIKGEMPDTSEYSQNDIKRAENCLIKYWDWEKSHEVEPIMVETSLVSETFKYGGTLDFFGKIDGQFTLVDNKTSKAIYPEFLYQLAAYEQLVIEQYQQTFNTDNVPKINKMILRIGRTEDEGFEELVTGDLYKHWQVFLNCQSIYNLQKEIRKG